MSKNTNGSLLAAIQDAALTAETGRAALLASMVAAWAGAKGMKPAAKVTLQRDMQRRYLIGTLVHALFKGDASEANVAKVGAILDGTDHGRKPKPGQHVRSKPELDAWNAAKMRWSGLMKAANIPALTKDGKPKAKAERKPKAPTTPAPITPAAKDGADSLQHVSAKFAELLAYCNKNAKTLPAGVLSIVQDSLEKMRAFTKD
jgi:hypothetical protein